MPDLTTLQHSIPFKFAKNFALRQQIRFSYNTYMFNKPFRAAYKFGLIFIFSLTSLAFQGNPGPPASHGGPEEPLVSTEDGLNQPIAEVGSKTTASAAPENLAQQSSKTPKGWKILEPNNANVTLTVPLNSTYKTTTTNSLVGDVTNHIYSGKHKNLIVMMDYTDIPDVAFVFTGDDSLYSQAKGSYLKNILAKESSFKKAEYNGISGMRLEFISPKFADHNGYKGSAFFFFIKHTLYIVSAYSKETFDDSQADIVFNSIQPRNQNADDD